MTIKISDLVEAVGAALTIVPYQFVAISAALGIASWVIKTFVLNTKPPIVVSLPLDDVAAPRTEYSYLDWDEDETQAQAAEPALCSWCQCELTDDLLLCPNCGVEVKP